MRLSTVPRLALPVAVLLAAAATATAQDEPLAYVRAEALRWRVSDAPLPFPLLTGANPNDPAARGTLAEPGTRILLGGEPVGLGTTPGARFTAGAWLDEGQAVAVEGSFFTLAGRTVERLFTDPDGTSRLGLPYFHGVTGAPSVFRLSFPPIITPGRVIIIPDVGTRVIPGVFIPGAAGAVRFNTRSELLGGDGNAIFTVERIDGFRADLLFGLRYLRLEEGLALEAGTLALPGPDGAVFTTRDAFATRNNFYGAQAGLRLAYDGVLFFGDVTGKIAYGPVTESVTVDGLLVTNRFAGGVPGLFPSGVYAQRTNAGTGQETRFTAVSEVQANAGVQFGAVRLMVGYSIIYVGSVARPGRQIDPFLNPNQSEALSFTPTPPGLNGGPPLPNRSVTGSSYWAQGWSVGVELRF